MILEVSPESSSLVRGAVAFILILHIGAGCVGLLSGAAALAFHKGSRLHRVTGNVFFVSMLIMATIGASVSPFLPKPQWANVAMGLFTCYLVATSWMTVNRKEGSVGRFEIGAFILAASISMTCVVLGVYVANTLTTADAGSYVGILLLFAAIVAFGAAGDLKMILRGGVCGPQRIARHLWRMCLALFIAALSFFVGQQKVFPAWLDGSPVLFAPQIAVLGLMVFWLLRVRRAKNRVAARESAS